MYYHIDLDQNKKRLVLKKILTFAVKFLEWGIFAVVLLAFLVVASPLLPTKKYISTYVVSSGSMEPAVGTGSVALVRPVKPDEVKAGDVIAFTSPKDPNQTILHRVISVKNSTNPPRFETKGDNNNTADNWVITPSSVKGKMLLSVPYLGHPAALMRTKEGFAVLIGIPALLLIFLQIKQIYQGFHEEIEKKTRLALEKMKTVPSNTLTMFIFGFLTSFTLTFAGYNNINALFFSAVQIKGFSFSVKDFVPPPVPSLLSPANDSYVNTNGLVMDWSDVADFGNMNNPVYYIYQSAMNPGFSPSAYLSGKLTQSRIPASGTADGQYWWRVKSCDALDNCSTWTPVWHMTVDSTPPSNFVLESAGGHIPINSNGDIYTKVGAPLMQWSDSTDANFDHYEYVVYTADPDPQGERDTPLCPIWGCGYNGATLYPPTSPLTVSQYQAGNTGDGVYYWRVYAIDKVGNKRLSNAASGNNYTWKVVIDRVLPVSSFSSPVPNTDVTGSFNITGTSTDNYGVASTELLYTNYTDGSCGSDYTSIVINNNPANNSPFNWPSTAWAAPGEGNYCLKAEATDLAGNRENSPVVENVSFHKNPEASLSLSDDKYTVGFAVNYISSFVRLAYKLTYETDNKTQAAEGLVALAGENTFTREITLGTCSETCTYDTGVKNFHLTIDLIDKDGKTKSIGESL